jgi:UDP:flavonoid glycosyltransferase YjiC (YdhE family)
MALEEDIDQYLSVIKALELIENSEKIRLLLSVGHLLYPKILQMIKKGELIVDKNRVLIMNKVPQLDVLKRAALFITHSGQKSTSEAVHMGVPMLCIPVMGDQMAVAYRMADELGLGKRLNYYTVDIVQLRDSILEILGDDSYLDRCVHISQLSRKHKGPETGAKIVMDYLLKNKSNN